MRVFKYLLIILIFASVIWFSTKELNIAGVYTDGYHVELDTPKSEVKRLSYSFK